ncbi:biotin-independent malonate decarboxylase subunit beta [Legionella maioricensis]|uniref:Malonate decarboxylase acyl carrier protein n=1 Tax=Legionella maioricensis TaxID=2896528 RepID=A0A9X2IBR5_9GAMM|nr:biotin-independent malonate decarboxylase subunit beta [Legionella maioricensis]MCL9684501.1 biotin-independent malonate decarboxylase subunit beta [Legionella maioricensis]MCL9687905.1 biotin-independent malonate decarboxylase subunit beta [Legionella maioricensis]
MESMVFDFVLSGTGVKGQRTVCGVVGSGNLEVIVEENDSLQSRFEIETAVDHYKPIWSMVIEDFVKEYQPVGLKFTLNDNGATPPVVSLRLRQAFEAFKGYRSTANNYLELGARERISALVDVNTFKEWLANEAYYSPHLAALGLPGEADDGIIIGSAECSKKKILIAAQQKDFMGGGVGEIHGAKLTGLFKAAVKLGIQTVILLIDSGGVRLHEANAGEIAISETIRAIFEARNQGVMTLGVICGKNGAFGGMGIISSCLDYLIVNEIARIGVSGADVIQAVKGVEVFDAQDRSLVWRVYGGKTRYLQQVAQSYVGSSIQSIKEAIKGAINKKSPIDIAHLKKQHALLKKRFESTKGYEEEGAYLAAKHPQYAATLFDMDERSFLHAAEQISKDQ